MMILLRALPVLVGCMALVFTFWRLDVVTDRNRALTQENAVLIERVARQTEIARLNRMSMEQANVAIQELRAAREDMQTLRDSIARAPKEEDGDVAPVLRSALDALSGVPDDGLR